MKIGYLGAGTWGFALSHLLAENGHHVVLWTSKPDFAELLKKKGQHPKLPPCDVNDKLYFTALMEEALDEADFIIESVTSTGLRPVLEKVKNVCEIDCPLIITSKGI